jgi:hypothetical protein
LLPAWLARRSQRFKLSLKACALRHTQPSRRDSKSASKRFMPRPARRSALTLRAPLERPELRRKERDMASTFCSGIAAGEGENKESSDRIYGFDPHR